MRKKPFCTALLILPLVLTSCVTNKKFTLLQKQDVKAHNVALDTTVRTYEASMFDYKLQQEDIISVKFESLTSKEYDFLSATQTQGNVNFQMGNALVMGELIDKKGEIPLPLMGQVKVAGMSVFEVQEKLQTLAIQYLESPVVKVRLLNFRMTILGEVNREGAITFTNNKVSLLEALGLAGGMTDLADKSKVKLIRKVGDRVSVVYLNLLDEDFINSPYYFVSQNDVLVVPPLKQRPFRKYFGSNFSLVVSSMTLIVVTLNLFLNYNNNP